MKKIFYSLIALALCSCAQSEVDDLGNAPSPEKNGLKFEVVDNGFIDDGSRVSYGDYVEGDRDNNLDAYKATFETGDEIGIYAIKVDQIRQKTNEDGPVAGVYVPTTVNKVDPYTVKNVKLTFNGKVWTSETSINFDGATLLFAYAPYSTTDYTTLGDSELSFTKDTNDEFIVNKGNNRFFVGHNLYTEENVANNGSKDAFEKVDMMGATYTLKGTENEKVTFNMEHMRGMIELTTPKEVTLTDLTLKVSGTPYSYQFYNYNEDQDRTKNVYRILTTEYRTANTLYATIKDGAIVKKFKKDLNKKDVAGYCSLVNIGYKPAKEIVVGNGTSLAEALKAEYGDNYATNTDLTSLRLTGTLQGANATSEDWATLRSLTTLTTLDMFNLTNESLPKDWLKNYNDQAPVIKSLTSLILPKGLTTIGGDALQVVNVGNIDIPKTVTTINGGAFYCYPASDKLSVRIPEGSQLATIGDGAFNGTKAVYTYDNNLSMVVLPKTLTNIGTYTVFGASSLRKVVFEGETAPTTIGSGAFGTNVVIYVPNSANYKGKNLFPGKTVFVGPILTVDNYTAVDVDGNPITREGSLNALCDGPQQTYWHSDYNSTHTYDKWGIYIDITLPKAYSNLKLSYTTRHNGNGQLPKKVIIGVATDNETFTEAGVYDATTDATVLPTNANETKELAISATSSYNKVRFGVTRSAITVNPPADAEAEKDANGFYITDETLTKKVKAWFALSELTVYEETWTEPAQ